METARIVNKSLEGQPEHAVLQLTSTKIFEFSNIVGENINDGDLSHPTIQRILNSGHEVQVSFNENDEVILHF
jgi:hypothetical protein